MLREEIVIETIPVGPLAIAALSSCKEMGSRIDWYISSWRKSRESEHKGTLALAGYERGTYLVNIETPRFGTGEGKGVIKNSIRGCDLYILVDVCNHSIEYTVSGKKNHMSPDDHYADLKRIIAATGGKARRISVIMPFLYESRQHRRTGRESLDCAMALQELYNMGVDNVITFDAHDPRVIQAAPMHGFENIRPSYQFLKCLFKNIHDIKVDKDHLLMISPDEGAMERAVYFANIMGIDMGMFYKRRDYSQVVNGSNPIVAHEYMGVDVAGKDVIIVDDMISSGGSMLETSRNLKESGAKRVFIFATFGLFTNGMDKFDKAYDNGWFDWILTTNLTYQIPELLKRKYYLSVDMSKYISYIIDTLNHDASISDLLDPTPRIHTLVSRYNAGGLSPEQIDQME